MPTASSARFVSYDLRPAKQTERRLMLESFLVAMESGFSIPDYRYVGMGGIAFYDFRLIHRYLGITNMISLEHDDDMVGRALFNRPYNSISVQNKTMHEFVLSDKFDGNSIYWLDYDSTISSDVESDIHAISGSATIADFVFVTVAGSVPKYLRKKNTTDRLVELNDRLPQLVVSLAREDMEDRNFPRTTLRMLHTAFGQGFSTRPDGEFWPFFRVQYADGIEMVTYGGVFARSEACRRIDERLRAKIPFIVKESGESYRIRRFNMTERERDLFDRAASATRSNAKEINQLYSLGFKCDAFTSYRELLRYHPRYVETLL